MVNIVILLGRLGQNAETKPINATNVARFSVATDRGYKKGDEWINETDWHNIEAWGLSEKTLEKLVKGAMVHISGSLKTEKWTDNEGHNRTATRIRATKIQILSAANQKVELEDQTKEPEHGEDETPF